MIEKKRIVNGMTEYGIAGCPLILRVLLAVAAVMTVVPPARSEHLRFAPSGKVIELPQGPPAFEVASIKPAAPPSRDGEGSSRSQIECSADGLIMRNIELDEMIEWAFGLDHAQILGPGALHGQRYDIRARTNSEVSFSTLQKMVQDLLSSRFRIRMHREDRLTSVYDLVVARGGARLTPSKVDATAHGSVRENLPQVIDGSFVFRNISIPDFAQQLSELRGVDFPVIDRTGIQGTYDITLKSAAREVLESDASVLPGLIREQLGLKLVPAKERREVLVVDHVEQPSPD